MRQSLFAVSLLCVTMISALGCGRNKSTQPLASGNIGMSDATIGKSVDENVTFVKGDTTLHTAVRMGDKRLFSKLLSGNADPNTCNADGTSVVHLAAEQEDVFWLREALEHGGDPNRLNVGNRFFPDSTPLFYAIWKERTATALELISSGADVNHQNRHGDRPLYVAYGSHLFEVMLRLLEAGADPLATTLVEEGLWDVDDGSAVVRMVDLIDREVEKEFYVKVNSKLRSEGYLDKKTP